MTALAGTSRCVWSASGDQSVRGWDPDSGQLLHVLTGHNSWVRCVLVVDEFVWSGADDASIKIWHQQTGRLENDLRGHTAAVHCLLRVGLQVFSGGADKVIRVWAAQGGRLLKELRGHESWVNCLLLREPFVWSGSSDRSIRLWNAASGACYKVLRGHTGWVWCMAGVGPDRVWSGSGDKSVRVWRDLGANEDGVDIEQLHTQVQQRVVRASVPSTGSKTAPAAATTVPTDDVRPRRTLAKHRRRPVAREPPVEIDNGDDSNDEAASDGGGFANHSWLADRRRNRRSPRDDAGMHALRAELSALRQMLPMATPHTAPHVQPAPTPFVPVFAPQAPTPQVQQPYQHMPGPVYAVQQPSHHLFTNGNGVPPQSLGNGIGHAHREPIAVSDDTDTLLQRKRELVAVEALLRSRKAEALELERQMLAAEEKQQAQQIAQTQTVQQPQPQQQQPQPQQQQHQPIDNDIDHDDKELELLRSRLTTAEEKLADSQAEQRRRGEASDALQRELDSARRREQDLQRDLSASQAAQRQLSVARDEQALRIDQLHNDLTASEARCTRAEQALVRAEQALARAEQALADSQRANNQQAASVDRHAAADRAAVDERVAGLVAQVGELERVVALRESSLGAARESVLEARDRVASLEADLLLSERHVAAAQQRAADDAAVFEQRIQVAESRSRDLAQQLNEHTQRAEAVEESHRVLAAAFSETVATQRELERQIELLVPLEAEVELLRSKLDSLRLVAHTVGTDGAPSSHSLSRSLPLAAAVANTPAPATRASVVRSRQRAEVGREQMLELSARLKTLVQHAVSSSSVAIAPVPRPAEVASSDDATRRADAVRIERLKQARVKLFGGSS